MPNGNVMQKKLKMHVCMRGHWHRMHDFCVRKSIISRRIRSRIRKVFSPRIRGPGVLFDEKTEGRKSRDIVPLRLKVFFFRQSFFRNYTWTKSETFVLFYNIYNDFLTFQKIHFETLILVRFATIGIVSKPRGLLIQIQLYSDTMLQVSDSEFENRVTNFKSLFNCY
jgi:hypothetical protein